MHRGRMIVGDYRALEDELWGEVERLQRADRLAPVSVVAPSRLLVRHLKVTSARRFPGGLFGVRFGTFFQFVFDLAGAPAEALLAEPISHERLLLEWFESLDMDGGPFPHAEARTYDVAGALAAAVRDLRDAAVPSEADVILERLRAAGAEAGTHLTGMDVRRFATVLHAYRQCAARLSSAAVLDRAGLYHLAGARADRGCGPLLVYGFYDMIQVQADLLAELARHTPVTLFVPHGADAEIWRFGDWFRNTFAPSVTSETLRRPDETPLGMPEIHSARGELDEMWVCSKEIRRLLDEGCPADEIAVVARTLGPYLRHVERLFPEHAIPYEGPSSRALLDQPLAQVIRLFFRLALEDFPRAAVLDVIQHPRFRAPGARRHWNLLSRALRIGRGGDWARLEPYLESGYRVDAGREEESARRVEITPEEVRGLWLTVSTLMQRWWSEHGCWRDHSKAHRAALEECFRSDGLLPPEVAALEAVGDVLETLGRLDRICGPVSRAAFLDAFDRECHRRFLAGPAGRGVAVLDAMAIRGLSFRVVFLVGMNARVFPRFIVEEPFISDAVRREVFRSLGHHLAVRMDGYAEERLLFHLVRTAASERLVCTYQRADVTGRVRDPSPFLRPFLPLEHREIDAVPHPVPVEALPATLRTPHEHIMRARDVAGALAAFGYDATAYRRACAFLDRLHDAREISEWEGRTGPLDDHWRRCERRGISPTGLELFGECPFRYFAREVLGLAATDEPADDGDLTPVELGRLLHHVLAAFYREVPAPTGSDQRLDELLEAITASAFQAFAERAGVTLGGLLAVRQEQVRRAIRAFAAWDLDHLGPWRPTWFEEGAGVEFAGLRISGRIDRIDRHAETGELRVVEYKRRFADHWSTRLDTQARRGQKLQGPLYMEAAPAVAGRDGYHEARVAAAVFRFVENYVKEDASLTAIHERRLSRILSAEQLAAARRDVEQAVATFATLMRQGWFVPRPDDRAGGHCSRCDFGAVCRKGYGTLRRKLQPDRTPALRPYWEVVQPVS